MWWSDGGRALHKDPDCPGFIRARVRTLQAAARLDWFKAAGIHSYDFANDSPLNGEYPPDRYMPCRRCS